MKTKTNAVICGLFALAAVSSASAEVWKLADGSQLRVDKVASDIVRVRRSADGVWRESGLNRYRFLPERLEDGRESAYRLSVDPASGKLNFSSRVSAAKVTVNPRIAGKGYELRFSLADGERVFGLGDSNRESVQRRPGVYKMWVGEGGCNLPIPMMITTTGWGVLNNSTWNHQVDVGKSESDVAAFVAKEGWVDFYLFVGKDLASLLDAYTRLTGRPRILPVWAYGLVYAANQEINDFELCAEARTYRQTGIPCDVIQLEPGWMSNDYDMTTKKYWDRRKFHLPYWDESEGFTFIGALERMGFKLSLWTCCDYDLTRWEEECYRGETNAWQALRRGHPVPHVNDKYHWWPYKFAKELDENYFGEGVQPWFEHYKKFVKQGVDAFKLDGCNQYGAHPDRVWANGMCDQEVHNLYTTLYARQMSRGFENFTDRRSFIYSGAGYIGVQHYVATWAGDTGGTLRSLMSAQCLGLSGHVNTSCDLDTSPKAMHYGFLQAWTFHDNWDFFFQPWYLGERREAVFKHYARLRYRLMPYLYSTVAEAHRTGMPVVRALALEYPDNPEYDRVKGTYLLGHDLLVTAFDDEAVIPPGVWYEWATGRKVTGPAKDKPTLEGEWTGGLYVRAGAVIPTWNGLSHSPKGWNEEVELLAWPHEGDGQTVFRLYEDDGNTLGYLNGESALTEITLTTRADKPEVTVGDRVGNFTGAGEVSFTVKIMPER